MSIVLAFALCALAFFPLVGWPLVATRVLVSAVILSALAYPAAATTVGEFLTPLAPGLLDLAGVILTLIIGAAARQWAAWTGVQIEARHREALHSAIMTAARTAIARGLTREVATEFIAAYVRASVPDALKRLSPSAETLDGLIRSKLIDAAGR
ncbi:hypothetical protein LV780_04935 [Cereibacter azotoformans]|uniref:hypothetical protein n=1 Tax=Cereibacter azotoformans TaxID=43057 RepID=UPI000E35FAD6|nr:hypothetical protein [Cereibacter azotoformans]AXQ93212.1 hypothetical protein D0Z66_04925 [Cereibacter sphaeroides]UIJ31526.1 hypothetical protein LV780_04935 [Cereibacter azotoformans]